MKRVTSILLSLLLVVSLTACDSTESGASDTLIIYFSESGNTETIANYIHDEIGGDMVQIIPTAEYPHFCFIATRKNGSQVRISKSDILVKDQICVIRMRFMAHYLYRQTGL